MSAIWGCVDLSGRPLPENLCEAMERPLRGYKIDRFAAETEWSVAMGCGLQNIKKWSEREALPVWDREAGVCFTADCLIDNRDELIAELCPGDLEMADGELLYLAWKRWGADAPRHVYGSYSFAVYEREKNRLVIAADHTASRSIYYCREGDRIFFGTVEQSLLRGRGGPSEVNDEWIALFLAMRPILILSNPEETVYKGIFRVVASCVNTFTPGGGMAVSEYWTVDQIPPLRLKSDAEYREYFREIFFRCAEQTVRGVAGETGILLSSGLDSASVAAAAAPALARGGKSLLGYTHVPVEGYVSRYNPRFLNTDERPGVQALCEMYPNIEPHFLPLPERDGFSNIRELLSAYMTPYKALVNEDWILGLESAAAADGCRLMLTGQLGNATISWGDMPTYLRHLITHGRPIKAITTLNAYAKMMGRSRKDALLHMLMGLLPESRDRRGETDWLEGSFVNREMAARLGIGEGDERILSNVPLDRPRTYPYAALRRLAFNKTAFAHIADSTTKLSLKNGQVSRDITRDIRIFEFCISSPIECSVNSDPATRRLVRAYLADRLPPEMVGERWPRGRQSADWLSRLAPGWGRVYADMERVCGSEALAPYAEAAAVEQALARFRDGPAEEDEFDFMRFSALYTLGLFLEKTTSEK